MADDEKKDNQFVGQVTENIEIVEEHEFDGLRRVAESVPVGAWFIVLNEFCERFAYYGGSAPFQNYVQFGPDDGGDQAGALAKGQSVATALSNFFTFFCYLTPLLGALVADQYLGRYRTILLFSSIYMMGWLILTCTATPSALAAGAGFPGYVVSLIVIGFGTGGIKGYSIVFQVDCGLIVYILTPYSQYRCPTLCGSIQDHISLCQDSQFR